MSETAAAVCEHLKTLAWSDYVQCLGCGAVVRDGSAPAAPVAAIPTVTVMVAVPPGAVAGLRAWVAAAGGMCGEERP